MQTGSDPRVRQLSRRPIHTAGRTVVYWMQNSQRPDDNPALDHAIGLANDAGVGVLAYVALDPGVPHGTARAFAFLLDGLRETVGALERRGIPTVVRIDEPVGGIVGVAHEAGARLVVTDLSPLSHGRRLRARAADRLDVPLVEIDGDHVVPLRAIGREHWAARTIRPVIHRLLPTFLHEPTQVEPRHRVDPLGGIDLAATSTDTLLDRLGADRDVPPAEDAAPGPKAARRRLDAFLRDVLPHYADRRRAVDRSSSGLSPYLRFGQISPLRIALAAGAAEVADEQRATFLEELIVRRELGSNFVYYNPRYRTLAGLPDWARATLHKHAADPRPSEYTRDELADARTHNPIWNAAQRELLARGRIHNHVRMYWGKKIIEWSATPADALAVALWLNDRFALDGRSANGYANVQWCFGKHDRPWAERPVFGTVRWMSDGGMRAKLDVPAYLRRWLPAAGIGDDTRLGPTQLALGEASDSGAASRSSQRASGTSPATA